MSEKSLNTQENIVLIDWFSFTSKIDDFSSLLILLGLDYSGINWVNTTGMHGYTCRKYFNGISIHYGGGENLKGTVWCEMSGQGCRAFEEYSSHKDWFSIFSLILADSENYHLTRLDVAYDDWQGVLNINTIKREIEKRNVVTKFRSYEVVSSGKFSDNVDNDYLTIYFGSKSSDILFRCYDKAAERGRSDEISHWVRFELQLRDDYALNFLSEYHNSKNIGSTFSGVVRNYIRFVKPSNDSNKCRWSVRLWWEKFLNNLHKISIFTKKETDYNIFKLEHFVLKNCGNAIDTYIQIFGIEKFVDDINHRNTLPNEKYLRLIEQSKKCNQIIDDSEDISSALLKLEKEGLF